MESEIKLPKKGIVVGVELENLNEFFNRTQHSKELQESLRF